MAIAIEGGSPSENTANLLRQLATQLGSAVVVIFPEGGREEIPQISSSHGAEYLSCAQIALKFRVSEGPLRKRLDEYRMTPGHDTGWVEVANVCKNKPKYLFRVDAIRHLISGDETDLLNVNSAPSP